MISIVSFVERIVQVSATATNIDIIFSMYEIILF